MIFSLLVQESAVGRQSSHAAYRFACALLARGHTLYRVFFFADGVHNSTALNCAASGEADLPALWRQLAAEHGVDLVSCVSSALRRGIVDEREAARHALGAASLRQGFELSGLGQLVEASIRSDRIVDFGG
ncbi:MAG: sulfurtransferase complex subunit TusD [Gammaproteobacteria bacterium]|jgi:tRNA 2-thiouridine synthesizing protein D|nr:sulfurtransferase complex subunit TusD [Gammaproteobacteria bacterium]